MAVPRVLPDSSRTGMKINFIDLKAQYKAYETEIDQAVKAVLHSGQFIGGPSLVTLENKLSEYTGAAHAVGCSSGTDALLLSLMALGIGPGDEVITSPFTFIATAGAISLSGARTVFVDIDEATYNIDTSQIENAINEHTKVIMPVSLYGRCADMEAINTIASSYNLPVIEDACQSFGAGYKGAKSCNLSTIGCTSFYPSKPLGCYGDGGAVFTSDDAIAPKIKMLLNHGQSKFHHCKRIGINGRLDAVQAAILNVKLCHFDDEVRVRQLIAERYDDLLNDIDVITPAKDPDHDCVYAQYSIRVKERKAVISRLNDAGVPYAIHYPVPLHLQEAFHSLGYQTGDFPVAETVSHEILSLPISRFLTTAQQDYVVNTIKG